MDGKVSIETEARRGHACRIPTPRTVTATTSRVTNTAENAHPMYAYRRQLSNYQKRLQAHRQASNNPIATLPDESSPRPPQKVASAEDQALVRHANSRDEYDKSIGYPLDAEGAVRPVRAGDSPTGVPATLLEFKPQ